MAEGASGAPSALTCELGVQVRDLLAACKLQGAVEHCQSALSAAAAAGDSEGVYQASMWLSHTSKLLMLASRGGRNVHDSAAEYDSLSMELFLYESMDMHLSFLADKERNEAFELALARTVKPDSHVFEVGTGTGLLAMLAAKAGAASVHACERVPWVAEQAAKAVQANGLAAQVTVLAAGSEGVALADLPASAHPRVEPVAHLPRAATLLLSEIVGNALVDEGMCGILNDAATRLLARAVPGAPSALPAQSVAAGAGAGAAGSAPGIAPLPLAGTFPGIPCGARLVGVVVEGDGLAVPGPGDALTERKAFDAPVKKRPHGLDFAAFNSLIPERGLGDDVVAGADGPTADDFEEEFMWTKQYLAPDVYDDPEWQHRFLSRPFELFTFDFTSGNVPLHGRTSVQVPTIASGTAHAVLVWLELQMDPAGTVWLTTCPKALRSQRGLWSSDLDDAKPKKKPKKKKKKGATAPTEEQPTPAPPKEAALPTKVFAAKNWAVRMSTLLPQPKVQGLGKDSLTITAAYADGVGVHVDVDWASSTLRAPPKPAAIAAAHASAEPSMVLAAMPPPPPAGAQA